MATIKLDRTTSCSRAINYAEKRANVKSGLNCDVDYAKTEMKQVRMLVGKDDKIQAHLVIQSFRPGEVTAEQANQMGHELAQKIAPHHQVSIYTHTDKDHIHNHLVINSIDLETGKKYQAHGKEAIERVQAFNDQLCLKHGLEVTQKENPAEKRTMPEIKLKSRGKEVWKDEIRSKIDSAMGATSTIDFKTFSAHLKSEGVNVQERGKEFSYEIIDTNRKVRGSKLGSDYEKDVIKNGLEQKLGHQRTQQDRTDKLNRSSDSLRRIAENARKEQQRARSLEIELKKRTREAQAERNRDRGRSL